MKNIDKATATEEIAPIKFDGEMPLDVLTSSLEYPRNLWCKYYEACLDVAVVRDWNSFSCEACGNRFKGLKRVYDTDQIALSTSFGYAIPENIPGMPEEVHFTEEALQQIGRNKVPKGHTYKHTKQVLWKGDVAWMARVSINNKDYYGRIASTEKEAALNADQILVRHGANLTRLNFPGLCDSR